MLEAQLKLAYETGYSDGVNVSRKLGYEIEGRSGRDIANQMLEDGYQKGLKEFHKLPAKKETIEYHVNKIFEYLKVTDERIINRYIAYILSEGELIDEIKSITQ